DLRIPFRRFDADGDGVLSLTEFGDALAALNAGLTAQHLLALFKHFDPNGSGTINSGEFLWAFFNRRRLLRQL
ncbi:polcalcin Nic t 1-like protein, partial [Tribonema minus]